MPLRLGAQARGQLLAFPHALSGVSMAKASLPQEIFLSLTFHGANGLCGFAWAQAQFCPSDVAWVFLANNA